MAHEMEENDHAFYGSLKPAWHGLGTVVDGTLGSEAAMKTARLDWRVEKEPVYVSDGKSGHNLAVPDRFATCRQDLPKDNPARILGIVSDGYEIIQNVEAFKIGDDLAGEGGVSWETAGSLRNGKLIWMLGKLPGESTVADDKLAQYILLSTGHTGAKALEAMFTPVRVVCANTLNMALRGAKVKASVWHNAAKDGQIDEAKRVLGLAGEYFAEHATSMNLLASTPVDQRFVTAYLQALWPTSNRVNKNGNPTPAEQTQVRIGRLFAGEQQGGMQDAVRGTAYGLLNAVGEFIDHERNVKDDMTEANRLSRLNSVWFGGSAKLKAKAFGLMNRTLGFEDGRGIADMAEAAVAAN